MNRNKVLQLLEKSRNERGVAYWEKSPAIPGLGSFGIGLSQLKTLAKTVGKNHDLAMELWQEPNYDAKIMAVLIDEPKKVTREQVEKQVPELLHWGFAHVYCSVLLPKVPFCQSLAEEWMISSDNLKRSCGFRMLYQIAKNDKKLPDEYFLPFIERIE
ncbi:MAG: DNA alkylation repair protein, partial [Calditrichaeota bacterium]|nr:DNA alkylation repair protein [Calditrichota bacterium]